MTLISVICDVEKY